MQSPYTSINAKNKNIAKALFFRQPENIYLIFFFLYNFHRFKAVFLLIHLSKYYLMKKKSK